MDWMGLIESLVPVVVGLLLGAAISLWTQTRTAKHQETQLDKQLEAQREQTKLQLRAQKETQLRERQLHAISEVSLALADAFKRADAGILEAATEAGELSLKDKQNAKDDQLRVLGLHGVILPPDLARLAGASFQASEDYFMSIVRLAVDRGVATKIRDVPDRRFELVIVFMKAAKEDLEVAALRENAFVANAAFRDRASAFANDTRLAHTGENAQLDTLRKE
jgi:hypothetical protein